MSQPKPGKIRRFLNWLFGSPFRDLPVEFGDPVEQDLRKFENDTGEMQHHAEGRAPSPSGSHKQAKANR